MKYKCEHCGHKFDTKDLTLTLTRKNAICPSCGKTADICMESGRAQEYLDQIDCDVYNGDTSLEDIQKLVKLLKEYYIKKRSS